MRVPRTLLLLAVLALALPGTAFGHWPVADRQSIVSQWYSSRHHAIDIQASCGTRIVAAKHGRVIWSGWRNNGGGYQVWVRTYRTGADLFTIYAHMRGSPPVSAGQWVAVGQRIGSVGATGTASGCHLHIEMWRGYPWRSTSWTVNPWSRVDHGYWFPYRYR